LSAAFQVIEQQALRVIVINNLHAAAAAEAVREALGCPIEPSCGIVIHMLGQHVDVLRMHSALLNWACGTSSSSGLAMVGNDCTVQAFRGIAADLARKGIPVGVFSDRNLVDALAYAVRAARLAVASPRTAEARCPSTRTRSAGLLRPSASQTAVPN
jgi:hypothetical protein